MPEFNVKEVRLPELHLPEIKRDEIVRALAGVHLPEVDLAKARQIGAKVPTVALTTSDVGRLLAAGAAAARFVRPTPSRRRWLIGPAERSLRTRAVEIVKPRPRRSRWPIAIGAILVIAVGTWMLLRRQAAQRSLEETARMALESFDELPAQDASTDAATDERIAVGTVEPAAIETASVAATIDGPATD
jgi:hypothetical protein